MPWIILCLIISLPLVSFLLLQKKYRLPYPLWAIFGAILLISLGGYFWIGSPELPSFPHKERHSDINTGQTQDILVSHLEINQLKQSIEKSPTKVSLWVELGEKLQKLGYFPDSARAFHQALTLQPTSTQIQKRFVETSVMGNAGIVPESAYQVLTNLINNNESKDDAFVLYFTGLAEYQRQDIDKARKLWERLITKIPKTSPWRKHIEILLKNASEKS